MLKEALLSLHHSIFYSEKAKVYAAIDTLLHKVRMIDKAMVLTMLQYEQSVGSQHALIKDDVGQLSQTLQGIGWIGKDKVKGFMTLFNVSEHIST